LSPIAKGNLPADNLFYCSFIKLTAFHPAVENSIVLLISQKDYEHFNHWSNPRNKSNNLAPRQKTKAAKPEDLRCATGAKSATRTGGQVL
jgi:hypothetical protein